MSVAAPRVNDQGRVNFGPFAVVTGQLFLVLLVMFLFKIEAPRGMRDLLPLIGLGFVVHGLLPLRYRMGFFLLLSVASVVVVLGMNSLWLFAIALGLIGACHLPIPMLGRVGIIVVAAGVLAALQVGRIEMDWAPMVVPILGGMFMFRLAIYLYDIRNEKAPVSLAGRLSYFFMLPNVCFPFFPVVDYRAFLRSHYSTDAIETYQKGVQWMLRGVVHLLLYRLIYQYFTLLPSQVETFWQVVTYMLATYLLYLRISGLFHLIVGILCLFGFNLPETHHFYYLASSFNDFWRRINIYWKDFMMKLFYYPVFMRARRLGTDSAMVIATIVVFMGTWLLHAYQWFWIRGAFPITTVDTLFWAFLGLMVVINSLLQAHRGKKASLGKPKWSWTAATQYSVQVVLFFTFMTVLWTFWSSATVGEWWSLMRVAGRGSAGEFGVFLGVLAGAVALGVGIQYVRHSGWSLFAKGTRPWYLQPAFTTASGAMVLAGLGLPEIDELLGPRTGSVLIKAKTDGLNLRDEQLLERGYYEGLLAGGNFGSRVWEERLQRPPADWIAFGESDAVHAVDGVTRYALKPSHESTHARVTIRTNQWGMRDQEYTLEKPADTYRILFLGASYEMGFAVEQDDIYEAIAEELLNQRIDGGKHRKIEILNCGVPGYGLIQWVEHSETLMEKFDVDAVFVTARTGDTYRTTGFLTKAVENGITLRPFWADLVERAGLRPGMPEAEMQRRLNRRRLTGPSYSYELYEWGYREIVRLCEEKGAVPVWVYVPRSEEVLNPNEKIDQQRMAQDAGFVVLDLDGVWEGIDVTALQVAPWDRHPNAEGHRILGTRLAEKVIANRDALGLEVEFGDGGVHPAG